MLQYVPYILLFALATMVIYGWGLWRSMNQNKDLSNLLCSKGIARIKKALKKNGQMSRKEMEIVVKDLRVHQPFTREQMGVTDPQKFLDSILPYMVKQRIILEIKENHKISYRLNK